MSARVISNPLAVYVRSERIGSPDKVCYLPVGLAYVAYEAAGLDVRLHFPVAEREFFLRPHGWNFEE